MHQMKETIYYEQLQTYLKLKWNKTCMQKDHTCEMCGWEIINPHIGKSNPRQLTLWKSVTPTFTNPFKNGPVPHVYLQYVIYVFVCVYVF